MSYAQRLLITLIFGAALSGATLYHLAIKPSFIVVACLAVQGICLSWLFGQSWRRL